VMRLRRSGPGGGGRRGRAQCQRHQKLRAPIYSVRSTPVVRRSWLQKSLVHLSKTPFKTEPPSTLECIMTESADAKNEALEALDAVEAALDGDVVIYNGPINEDGYGQFVAATRGIKALRRIVLVLVTYGGSADSAYRIARFAQNYFRDFVVYVPSACKSAGTLLSLGARTIYMSPFGEFGPLDVQVYKSDEIFERRSGLLSKSAVWSLTEESFRMFEEVLLGLRTRSGGTIGFKTASQVAAAVTTGLMSQVIGQIDPLAMGQDFQNLKIAHDYGKRLIEKFQTVNDDAVRALVEGYPSHGFVIDYFEAAKLFGNVELATGAASGRSCR
jgi:hypothetical protein